MTIGRPDQAWLQGVAGGSVFLSFALVAWPMWVPISLFVGRKESPPQRALAVFSWVGAAVGVCAAEYF